jgi:hypothetical protein
MYISKMTNFLDETGEIPKLMPKPAREMASFMALVVDVTTKHPYIATLSDIRCFQKGCQGLIKSEILGSTHEVHWKCSKCNNEGRIDDWQGTRWDNSGGNIVKTN